MDTDEHGWEKGRIESSGPDLSKVLSGALSVSIGVHPWFNSLPE
jgi:hypothetical protein